MRSRRKPDRNGGKIMMSFAEKTFWYSAKVVDDQGVVYRVADASASTEIGHSVVLNVEPVKRPLKDYFNQAGKPDFDGMAKYIFGCMVAENLLNPECKIGTVKTRLEGFLRAAAYLENISDANPEPRPE